MHVKNWTPEKVQDEEDRLAALWEVTLAAKALVDMAEGKGGEGEKDDGQDDSSETVKGDNNSEGEDLRVLYRSIDHPNPSLGK